MRVTVGALSLVLTATASGGLTAYNVEVRYIGGAPSPQIQSAFQNAAARVQLAIAADLPNIALTGVNANGCASGAGTLTEAIVDILIFAIVTPIDGVGQILGQAGPCLPLRPTTGLPYMGVMQFDSADLDNMVANGTINAVVLHEMFHVLGFGVLWSPVGTFPKTLISGRGSANSLFTGAMARDAYVAAGGTAPTGVPLENCVGAPASCGSGTRDSHWREALFLNELMTGYISGSFQPLSAMSIASLGDVGYTVSTATADAYTVPPPGQLQSFGAAALFGHTDRAMVMGSLRDATGREIQLEEFAPGRFRNRR